MSFRPFVFLIGLLALPVSAQQVRLNEFMAENVQSVPDIVDFEDYPDWIEIQNTTSSVASLTGFFLSDDPARPLKWMFPATASVPANGYLRVWADGHSAAPGQTFPRGYWPWRSFTTEGYHAGFKLAPESGSLILTQATGISTTTLIQSSSASWKYLADGSDQSTQWRVASFDDAAWSSGVGPLGYGDSWIATTVPYGSSATNKHITTYFRRTFFVASPAAMSAVTLRLMADDGAIVYINGTEVIRENMPAGDVSYLTLAPNAVSGTNESDYSSYVIPVERLVAGTNIIAVELHQNSASSTDLSFDLGLEATQVTATTQVDSVSYTQQIADVSMGRDPGNPTTWVQFSTPTPGSANSGGIVASVREAGPKVTVSLPGGFYSSSQTVALTATAGQIYYTLDGSTPGPTSSIYSTPLSLSTTTVLRARAYEVGKPLGPVETRTYFFGETQGTVPYVSVVADPKVLFDDQIGVYYNLHEQLSGGWGLHDEYKNKDAPASLEYYEAGGSLGFSVRGGIRMGGENNWYSHSQRAMNFNLDSAYGDDVIKYNLFPNAQVPLHIGLTLREGGDNWDADMLRDAMWSSVALGKLTADTSDYHPAVVFINGQYWGVHDLRQRWDEQWFFEHKRINSDDIVHLGYGHFESNSITLGSHKGDVSDWLDLINFLNTADLTQAVNYQLVASRIDIDSFIDFVVSESYAQNIAWPHNREFWRDRKAGGKWHWFLPDMDRTFQTGSLNSGILGDLLASDQVLTRLKTSPLFVERLAQRFAAHVASTFKPWRITGIVDTLAAEVDAEIPRHVARWSSVGGTTVSARNSAIQDIKNFAVAREANIHAELQSELGLGTAVNLSLSVSPSNGGKVKIAGVAVDSGTVKMFPNAPFDIQAEAAPGYAFAGWTGASGGASTSLTLTGAASVTATFVPTTETVVGGTLSATQTWAAGSYCLSGDLIVPPGVTLTVSSGVSISMLEGIHLRVQGALRLLGTTSQPVHITGRNGARWGGVSFENPTGACQVENVVIRGATRGKDPTKYPSAVSALNATLSMDGLDIDQCECPIFCRGGSTTLLNSTLRTPITGDGINVKGGAAEVRNCTFFGNFAPDTDAIDYDAVVNGVIANNRIYRFLGFNSDAIDIGEAATNVLVEGNIIMENSDKGVSVGQGSTATIRRNLIVECALGVGLKDAGSHALIDQNTIVHCDEGVAAYEKNFGLGGGTAAVENTLFSKCAVPVIADSLSTLTVAYCLSDTVALAGTGNLVADPLFVDISVLNYSIQAGSPAVDAGDPAHANDADGSRADIGDHYSYSPADYPFTLKATVVIEEVLANSGAGAADWIELHNRTGSAVDISGWFLSDDSSNLMKYRIPAGTLLAAGGYVVFYEDSNFGATSSDPGRLIGFGLSDAGETVYLSSASNNVLTDYQTRETFGASMEGESIGNIYKASTDTWNFVPLELSTPGAVNSGPRVGPIVISEIHYAPAAPTSADAEFIELMNVSSAPVTMFDSVKASAWRVTEGVVLDFPTLSPVTIAVGERIVLTRSIAQLNAAYSVPSGTQVFQWTSGRLSNDGEAVQISQPAGVDALNVRQYARVDKVNFSPLAPWPSAAASGGPSLNRISLAGYGNDHTNWMTAVPSPGAAAPVDAARPSISTTSLLSGYTLAPYSVSLAGTGGVQPYNWSVSIGSVPPGLNFSSSGQFTGLPTTAGTYHFTVRLSDAGGLFDTRSFSMSIITSPVTITTPAVLNFGVKNIAYKQTLLADGTVNPASWSVFSGVLPGGLTLNTSGQITGKPLAAGTFNFAAKVTDGAGVSAVKSFVITVQDVFHTPVITTSSLNGTTVGAAYSQIITAQNTPTSFAFSGLPKGVVGNTTNGQLGGRAAFSGVYMVTIIASNPAGTSARVMLPLIVKALPSGHVGAFSGLIARDDVANAGLGAKFTLNTSASGAFTVRVVRGTATSTAIGFLKPAAPQVQAVVGGSALSLTINAADGSVSGYHGSALADGWRSVWTATYTADVAAGYYSIGLDLADAEDLDEPKVPQGNGFAWITIKPQGTVMVVGKTADGQVVSSASTLGAGGELAIYSPLYKSRGSVHGGMTLSLDGTGSYTENAVAGALTWNKPGSTGALYGDAFGPINLLAYGKYLAPSPKEVMILGLPTPGTASLEFIKGGIDTFAVSPDIDFNYTAALLAIPPSVASGGNPANTTISINKQTGAFSGAFSLKEPQAADSRAVRFQGAIVRSIGGAVSGKGYFLLPQKRLAGDTRATIPVLSGQVKVSQ